MLLSEPVRREWKDARVRGHLGRGTLVSLLLHLNLLVPLLILVFYRAQREEAERPEEVDVGFENVNETVRVDRFFIGQTREVFALRVKGDSMIEDGIFDGDYIFVRKQLQANKGETVVAMIEGEATVKRYYPEGDVIRFQPANASMEPIYVRKRDFKSVNLLGIVIGVYRRMS